MADGDCVFEWAVATGCMGMTDAPICTLQDCTVEWATEDGVLVTPGDVYSVDELVGYLNAAATRSPHKINMNLPGDLRARIAIGGPWAAINFMHLFYGRRVPADHPPTWHAVPDRSHVNHDIEFVSWDTSTDIAPKWLLPVDQVIGIAAHLARHRTLPDTCQWVDDRGERYHGRCGEVAD